MTAGVGYYEVRLIGTDGLTKPETAAITAMVRELVAGGAALGWVDPPEPDEVELLLAEVTTGIHSGDAALAVVFDAEDVVAGFGYWRRYLRPTHRPHADVEKLAIAQSLRGRGAGRAVMTSLIAAAQARGVEVLTLDLRGDNTRAAVLYESLGFHRYGVLERFVAVGGARYDKLLYAIDLR
ncbi:GNAT family N-acetyltransferase [Actinoplanes sp. NPDC051851]|uniref:GNAT family N-acetyltransferase n=1 Tax=Actinoplanes sp. NPDC051851 TaxID=3154753 RepID=UPI003422D1C5